MKKRPNLPHSEAARVSKMITITITQTEALTIKDALQPFAEKRNPPRSNRKACAKNLINLLQREVWADFKREVSEDT